MTKQFTPEELECLTGAELYALYIKTLNDMARLHRSVPKCPVAQAYLDTIRHELLRRWLDILQ